MLMMCMVFGRRNLMSKRNFKVTITETLKRTVEVEADDRQEAEQMVSNSWYNSNYILGSEDFVDVDFEAIPATDDASK